MGEMYYMLDQILLYYINYEEDREKLKTGLLEIIEDMERVDQGKEVKRDL